MLSRTASGQLITSLFRAADSFSQEREGVPPPSKETVQAPQSGKSGSAPVRTTFETSASPLTVTCIRPVRALNEIRSPLSQEATAM